MIAAEIEIWKSLAKIEVEQAKEFGSLANTYLLLMINEVRKIISDENPFAIPASDLRYKSYVIKIMDEYRKQKLPDFEGFVSSLLMGRLK